MSFSIENLLNDAIKLSNDLKECETESDNLIYRTVNLQKDNQNLKEYTEEMNNLSNTSIKQPRKNLIASIQCESKKMKLLEAENLELKNTLKDYEIVMELMSQKYRNHISKLISHLNIENKLNLDNCINLKYKQKIDEQSQKIDNLMQFIHRIINLDVDNFLDIQKSLTKLELENEGLRQILGIAKEHNSFKPSTITNDICIQVNDIELINNEKLNSNNLLNNNLNNSFNNTIDDNEKKKFNDFINDVVNDLNDSKINDFKNSNDEQINLKQQNSINETNEQKTNKIDSNNFINKSTDKIELNDKNNTVFDQVNCATIKKVIKNDKLK